MVCRCPSGDEDRNTAGALRVPPERPDVRPKSRCRPRVYINIFKNDAGMQVGGGWLPWMDLADPLGEAEAKPDT